MLARALMLAAALLGTTAAARPTWKQVAPLHDSQTVTIAADGVAAVVTAPPPYPEDREVSDEEFQAVYENTAVAVRFPGLPPYEVPKDEARSSPYGLAVGIGRLAETDAAPSVLLAGYTGGAHCCGTLQVVSLVDGKPVSTVLPMADGEPLAAFPKDIDGDGVRDIRWNDDSLLYQFTSHAGSWQVPRIYHIERGEPVDVSRQAGFAPVYRRFAAETLKACRKREIGRNGACAAYAYARAIQGQPEDGIRTAVSLAEKSDWLPSDCTVEYVDDLCPEGKERTFARFEDALRWIMRENGYLPK